MLVTSPRVAYAMLLRLNTLAKPPRHVTPPTSTHLPPPDTINTIILIVAMPEPDYKALFLREQRLREEAEEEHRTAQGMIANQDHDQIY